MRKFRQHNTLVTFPTTVRTKRTILRQITLDDAKAWKSFNNKINKKMESWPIVPSIVYARNEILNYERVWKSAEGHVYVVIAQKTGKLIGDVHLKKADKKYKRVEFGHALTPEVWGTGITYELLDAIKTMTKRKKLIVWGKVEEENIRSWKSLEKYGATYTGKKKYKINNEYKQMRVYEL